MAKKSSFKSPTISPDGKFAFSDGSSWNPYIEYASFRTWEIIKTPDIPRMVAELLLNEVLFLDQRYYIEDKSYRPNQPLRAATGSSMILFLTMNKSAISVEELPSLYDAWAQDTENGVYGWLDARKSLDDHKPE